MIKQTSNLPPDEASSNPHCFCYCRQPVDNTIIAYIVVMAIFSPTQHSQRFGIAARTFGVENLPFLDPTQLDKQSKKSTLNANWMYTLFIPFMCSSAFVLLVFSIIVTLCIAFQGAMSFSPTGKSQNFSLRYIMVKYDTQWCYGKEAVAILLFVDTFWEEFLKSTIYYQRLMVESCQCRAALKL